MSIDNEKIAALVTAQIQERFDHNFSPVPYDESRGRDGDQYFSLPVDEDMDITGQSLGVFDMVVTKAWLQVRAGIVTGGQHGEHYNVMVALHYNHHSGGSNGSNVGTFWFTKDYALIGFRAG